MKRCKNCDTPLESTYCPECGQRDVDLEQPFMRLMSDALRDTFDVDGRAARTLSTLLRRPGTLTSEYLAGRRRLYSPPFRTYLVISVLFFLLTEWIVGQGLLLTQGQTLETDAEGQARLFADYVPRLMFVLLPVFALLLKTAFRTRRYFDHLIHALHLHSAAFIVLALMMPFEQAASDSVLALVVQAALFCYLLASFVTSLRKVYETGWLLAAAKAFGILLAYTILVAGSFEAVSRFLMPDSPLQPYLSD